MGKPCLLVRAYLRSMHEIRSLRAGTGERSYYPALQTLLNDIGEQHQPRVLCVQELADQGAGHPDFGLYSAGQLQARSAEPRPGALPERGVIEAKPPHVEVHTIAASRQVMDYWNRYGLVLVTNFRAFQIVGRDQFGHMVRLEEFTLADSDAAFWTLAAQPARLTDFSGHPFHRIPDPGAAAQRDAVAAARCGWSPPPPLPLPPPPPLPLPPAPLLFPPPPSPSPPPPPPSSPLPLLLPPFSSLSPPPSSPRLLPPSTTSLPPLFPPLPPLSPSPLSRLSLLPLPLNLVRSPSPLPPCTSLTPPLSPPPRLWPANAESTPMPSRTSHCLPTLPPPTRFTSLPSSSSQTDSRRTRDPVRDPSSTPFSPPLPPPPSLSLVVCRASYSLAPLPSPCPIHSIPIASPSLTSPPPP